MYKNLSRSSHITVKGSAKGLARKNRLQVRGVLYQTLKKIMVSQEILALKYM